MTALERELTEGESLADLLEQIGNHQTHHFGLKGQPSLSLRATNGLGRRQESRAVTQAAEQCRIGRHGVLVEKAMGSKEAALSAFHRARIP